ncbi:MAG: hypothetical protein HOP12_06780 [Candidatus Eisenbacteria bacterium]|uniref:Anti-sigma-28 factor FlgM C-terminal domain-containing protein n=1 Tax=Eiseniibacteriota bacterium TaxID=2212470 RepID=A0A849SDR6_UNCEI|nr:hypothetical protein [Candidatus Eisenbacteria bacterium]
MKIPPREPALPQRTDLASIARDSRAPQASKGARENARLHERSEVARDAVARGAEHGFDERDRVELSSEAREMSMLEHELVPPGDAIPGRISTILGRLADGFYDSEPVRSEVLSRLLEDLNGSSSASS